MVAVASSAHHRAVVYERCVKKAIIAVFQKSRLKNGSGSTFLLTFFF